jgi:hypothetical protein
MYIEGLGMTFGRLSTVADSAPTPSQLDNGQIVGTTMSSPNTPQSVKRRTKRYICQSNGGSKRAAVAEASVGMNSVKQQGIVVGRSIDYRYGGGFVEMMMIPKELQKGEQS